MAPNTSNLANYLIDETRTETRIISEVQVQVQVNTKKINCNGKFASTFTNKI